jgi:hypothetical protein
MFYSPLGLMKSNPILLKTFSEFQNPPQNLSISIDPRRFYYIQRGFLTESMVSAVPGVFGVSEESKNNVQAYTLSPWVSNIDIGSSSSSSSGDTSSVKTKRR